MPLLLSQMPLELANQVYGRPLHHEIVSTLTELITSPRQCRCSEDYFLFQQDLLDWMLAVQDHRAACRRVAKLMRQGKSVPADAPERSPVGTPDRQKVC